MIPEKKQALQVALVTGAARRIGHCIAQMLHQQGYCVAIHYHQAQDEAAALAKQLNQIRPNSAAIFAADFKNPASAVSLIDAVHTWRGQLDVLVNNASVFERTTLSTEYIDWTSAFHVNVATPFALSMKAFPLLVETEGCIVNITDIHADKPLKGYAAYCQTKAALWMQTQALAREFAPKVRVNAVAPGSIAWPEADNALSESIKQHIIQQTPLLKHGDPIFIAQAVLALIENPFITGECLRVDGGRHLA